MAGITDRRARRSGTLKAANKLGESRLGTEKVMVAVLEVSAS
jgi:hypothetical protein